MAILVVAVAFVHFDFLGVFKPLEDCEVVSCDGKVVMLDGQRRSYYGSTTRHGSNTV